MVGKQQRVILAVHVVRLDLLEHARQRPLRLVLVGDGHYTLVSDDYGDTFTEAVPWDATHRTHRSLD